LKNWFSDWYEYCKFIKKYNRNKRTFLSLLRYCSIIIAAPFILYYKIQIIDYIVTKIIYLQKFTIWSDERNEIIIYIVEIIYTNVQCLINRSRKFMQQKGLWHTVLL